MNFAPVNSYRLIGAHSCFTFETGLMGHLCILVFMVHGDLAQIAEFFGNWMHANLFDVTDDLSD